MKQRTSHTTSKHSDYHPFGLRMYSRSSNSSEYRYGFNTQENVDEIAGEGNHTTALYWEYDTRLGRRWNQDPKPNPSISNYATFANNPIWISDVNGDTTYRFNESDGAYIGMFDLESKGSKGSYGSYNTIGNGDNQQQVWDGQYFNFADPKTDSKQIQDGLINKLIFVSNDDIKGMLKSQGAFNEDDKNNLYKFYKNSKGGQNFDYSYSVIPNKYSSQGASSNPLNNPSPLLFLPEGDYTAHNHMNFGNYLWGASGFTLGFSYFTLQTAAHVNSLINSTSNGYPSQLDSEDDQNSIKKGAFYSDKNDY